VTESEANAIRGNEGFLLLSTGRFTKITIPLWKGVAVPMNKSGHVSDEREMVSAPETANKVSAIRGNL